MAYDEVLAERIRGVVAGARLDRAADVRRLAFLIGGHMAVSASSHGGLLLRVDPAETESLVIEPHVQRFVMAGREMNGWLHIEPEVLGTDDELRRWADHGVSFARSLPQK